jgi:hypothetical protein
VHLLIESIILIGMGFFALYILFKVALIIFGSAAIGTAIVLKSDAPLKDKAGCLLIVCFLILLCIGPCTDNTGLLTEHRF